MRVVILGQDVYHGPGQAHGLAFSVKPGVDLPPSLVNIFKEISSDLNYQVPTDGHLERWAKQGVLLLNSILTVRNGQAGSHAGKGWEQATDLILQRLGEINPNGVYLLWGNFARSKKPLIKHSRGILEAAHPSPLSAHKGFFGCKHFSKANELLKAAGLEAVQWGS